MDLFPLVKVMFTKPSEYAKLKNSDKAGNHFMINRFMAINYPKQAQQLNQNGIIGWAVVDTWQRVTQKFNRVPGWIYTKSKPVVKTKKKKEKWIPSEELIKFYIVKNAISREDFDTAMEYNKDELTAYLKKIEEQINVYSN